MSFGLSRISDSLVVSSLGDFLLGVIFLGGGEIESQSCFSEVFLGFFDVLLFMVHNLDGSVDSISSSKLLFFNLTDVVLNWNVSVGNFDEIGS